MASSVRIGGLPVITLWAPEATDRGFVSADILPGRGMTTLQIRARTPELGELDVLASPSAEEAARVLDGGADDHAGSKSFSLGGALLIPYANRIRGRLSDDGREIETQVAGRTVRLPANWGGQRPGAERYAMHGLILDAAVPDYGVERRGDAEVLTGALDAGDFGGRWPSRCRLEFEIALSASAFEMRVSATNIGDEVLPMGIGWHPWFNLPSGRREQARLTLPANARTLVNDYDAVLPTGEVAPVAGTPHDFREGRALDDLYLDDCFTDLVREDGELALAFEDPTAGYGLALTSASPAVKAVQVYAPLDRPVLVIEPQFNVADPFAAIWRRRKTGMTKLVPGQAARYLVRLQINTARFTRKSCR
ncbi:aldose 1-epimerase [Brevundimonas sp.]|uniref:aldose 1-epimerase n=1 Tax=Brevundimonas sp. TaxID=1871086 RepID=UPI0025E94C3C|nr:aldose 1-epimerase [Brevundimonas sp.]